MCLIITAYYSESDNNGIHTSNSNKRNKERNILLCRRIDANANSRQCAHLDRSGEISNMVGEAWLFG